MNSLKSRLEGFGEDCLDFFDSFVGPGSRLTIIGRCTIGVFALIFGSFIHIPVIFVERFLID